jgi:3-phosphoshikimate 1-carboxyvinyltransferase
MTNTLSLKALSRDINQTIQLTGSKSESNRALIIRALSDGKVRIRNLSRFLTAYLPLARGSFLLTGSERMKQRPIGILSDAMKSLGASIEFAGEPGYPPLRIQGGFRQQTAEIDIQGNVSSQYISALLLIAAALPEGLKLNIVGELTSRPYVEMTLAMLAEAGIEHTWNGQQIAIAPQQPRESELYIEPDWSAASYWYAIVALSDSASIRLPGLRRDSLQGDQEIKDIMQDLGVVTVFTQDGISLTKIEHRRIRDLYDFKSCPDLAQTVITCCAALGIETAFTGLETLKIKETDRILALQNELAKFGVKLYEAESGVYRLDCSGRTQPEELQIKTYEDHRMAMAFAPLALVFDRLVIEEPAVVEKSYPLFWEHLKKVNFKTNA